MGCAGSRPSHLIQSFGNSHHHHHHHVNSPQKGFILFNAKTIEYLQANELEIKEKLRARCELKLTKAMPQSMSSKSLLSNAKRTLLFNNSTSGNSTAGESVAEDTNKSINGVKQNKSDASLTLNGTINQDSKVMAIDAAVDYVLKYALNDFDIENFKSSNHLSMKQIRKDIVKKNNSVSSLSKLNNSVNNSTAGTLTNQSKNATLSKGFDASFYKQALNVAIDEFGLFVQENFIIINEFEKSVESEKVDQVINEAPETENKQNDKEEIDVEALKLKEALEVARHNFYKGKISMVCLTKAGGYVVKEVKDQGPAESEGVVLLTGSEKKEIPSPPKTTCIIPEINIQSAEQTEKSLEAKSEKISQELTKIEKLIKKAFEDKEALNVEELLIVKSNLIEMLNKSVDSVTEFTKNQTVESKEAATALTSNLGNSKRVVELLKSLNETEAEKVDHSLVEALINLDNVNKELKSFINKTDGNSELKGLVVDIENLNQELPTNLFTSKSFKAPATTRVEKQAERKYSQNSPTPVDIKKEIAFSILNVGEVLAKTIDYYSHDPQSNEMKDLIAMSNKQETNTQNTEAPSNAEKLSHNQSDNEMSKEQSNHKSCSSSLVSPSVSTSSSVRSLPQDSASPVHQKFNADKDLKAEPTTPVPPPELNLDSNNVAHDNKLTPQQEVVERASNLVDENIDKSCDVETCEREDFKPLDNNEIIEEKIIEEETVVLIKSETKSSSSSSDVLSNEEILIETTEKVVHNDNNEDKESSLVVFRNGETLNADNQANKRMSLDEELFYHLEDVDKKVKYMNETCSEDDGEDDDDDDLDDENFDYDESVELENANDERLFHPRTPAKIKSEVRNNRAVDLQEEIKQISNVIQDLVQTINVRNNTNNADIIPQQTGEKISLDNNTGDSEDGSQSSGSGGDSKTKSYHYNRNSSGSHNSSNIADRKSVSSRRSVGNQSLNSSIPISVSRQKIIRKSTTIEDTNEYINSESTNNSFVDYNMEHELSPERSQLNNSNVNKSASSQRFRSKLPVKK